MGLTIKRIARAKEPGRYLDGAGLYLQVTPTLKKDGVKSGGVKSWILRYERNGVERYMGLGPLHAVSLEEARARARKARQQLLDGVDPIAARQAETTARRQAQAKAITFAEAAQSYFEQHANEWRNAKHAAQFLATLSTYVYPFIGALPVAEVTTPAILRILEQKVAGKKGYATGSLWSTRRETASRVRQRIERVLDWAAVRGHRSGDNPARWKGHLEEALPARNGTAVEHHAALPFDDLPAFMHELSKREAMAATALRFLILTAARTGEVVGATWSEFDLTAAVWTIPAKRMKAQAEHRVPLSPAAVDLLRGIYRERGNDHVFIGSQTGKGLSNMAMATLLGRMGRTDITVHGFRSTFRDWASERTSFPPDVVEMALAHAIQNKVEAAYRRGDLFEKRRKLMASWSEFCASPAVKKGDRVVSLRKR